MTIADKWGREMTVSYERGVQINILKFALEDIARRTSDPASRRTAQAALARVPEPYPLDAYPMQEAAE